VADEFPVPKDEPTPKPKTEAQKHKRNGPPKGSPAAKAAGARGRAKVEANEIAREITEAAGGLGALAIPFAPLPGGYLVKTSDELGAIVGRLVQNNPTLRAALLKSSTTMDYVALGVWSAGLLASVGVQFGRLPVDGMVAQHFEIDKINAEFLREVDEEEGERDDRPDRNGDGGGLPRPEFLGERPVEAPERLATG
jgi:hypothetical protein